MSDQIRLTVIWLLTVLICGVLIFAAFFSALPLPT